MLTWRASRLRLLDINDAVMGKRLKQAMLAVRRPRGPLLFPAAAMRLAPPHCSRDRPFGAPPQDSFKAMHTGSAGFTSKPLK